MQPPIDPADHEAILALTRRLCAAWDDHDGAAYATCFTADSDYVAFDGTHLRSRTRNAEHHQALYNTVLAGSRLRFEGEPELRPLTADVVLMHARGAVLLPWQQDIMASRRSIQTCVLVRQGGKWRIAAFHNTRFRPLAMPRGFRLRLIQWGMRLRTRLSPRRLAAAS